MLTPGKNIPSTDLVMTPPELAQEIVSHFDPQGKILDPARGDGAFYNALAGRDRDYCELLEGKSFYSWFDPVDVIITNPPWSKLRGFLTQGYRVSNEIIYLAVFTHFVTRARLREMRAYGFGMKEFYGVEQPKKPWPSSGFQLGAMHLVKNYKGPLHLTGNLG